MQTVITEYYYSINCGSLNVAMQSILLWNILSEFGLMSAKVCKKINGDLINSTAVTTDCSVRRNMFDVLKINIKNIMLCV